MNVFFLTILLLRVRHRVNNTSTALPHIQVRMPTPALPLQIQSADTQSQMLLIRGFFLALLLISIVLMLIPNRIRISMLISIHRIRIRIRIKMMPILMRIIPQISHMLDNQIFYFQSQLCQFTMFYLSHQCRRQHSFKYFDHHIEIFWKKVIVYQLFHMPGIDTDPDRHALDAEPDPDLANDADPTRSGYGSTTLLSRTTIISPFSLPSSLQPSLW